jgi:hypothetical protein
VSGPSPKLRILPLDEEKAPVQIDPRSLIPAPGEAWVKIDSLEISRVAMPLVYPFCMASGNNGTIESVLAPMVSDGTFG